MKTRKPRGSKNMKPTKIERRWYDGKRHDILASYGTFLDWCQPQAD